MSEKIDNLHKSKQSISDKSQVDVAKVENELNMKYSKQLSLYKQTLIQLKAREPEIKTTIETLHLRNESLERKLILLEQDSIKNKEKLEITLNELKTEKEQRHLLMTQLVEIDETKSKLIRAHENQLQDIDNKVRTVIASKDDALRIQARRLEEVMLRNTQLEKFMNDLNEGISSK